MTIGDTDDPELAALGLLRSFFFEDETTTSAYLENFSPVVLMAGLTGVIARAAEDEHPEQVIARAGHRIETEAEEPGIALLADHMAGRYACAKYGERSVGFDPQFLTPTAIRKGARLTLALIRTKHEPVGWLSAQTERARDELTRSAPA